MARRYWSEAALAASVAAAERAAADTAAASERFADRFAGIAVSAPSICRPVSRTGVRGGKVRGGSAASVARRAY